MKWMMSSAVALAISAAVSAQSSDMKQSKMNDAMHTTYTGCVMAINHGGTFLLTHFDNAPHDMHAEMHDEMRDDQMTMAAFVLTGRSDLKKHVGHKVTVTGSVSHAMPATMPDGRDTLAISSLKMVAKSCS